MPILNIVTSVTGEVGLSPKFVYIATNDTLATVLTAGYLNKAVQNGAVFREDDMALVSTKTSPSATSTQVALLELSYSPSTGWSLVTTGGPGTVILPTIANHIATYTNTSGTLSEDAATAINGGNIQAGLSGTAGYLASFPSTAAKGSLRLTAVANTGDTLTTISNAAMGQASVISIPDPGASTATFTLSTSSGGQTIAGGLTVSTGNFAVSAGTITASGSITSTAGNITSGSSGDAGTFISFPATAANGTLILAAANAGGAFNTTISNGTMAQSTVYTVGDIGASTGAIPVSTTAARMKWVSAAAAAGGAAAQSFTDTFCTTGSVVIGDWNTQANAASVLKIVPGNGSFVVTSSADAGVGTFNYLIIK
jgi:hypothetical protein